MYHRSHDQHPGEAGGLTSQHASQITHRSHDQQPGGSVADPGGAKAPSGPVKIGHKKDGHRRWPHRFHVSRLPLTRPLDPLLGMGVCKGKQAVCILVECLLVTACNEVIFSLASMILFTGGGCLPQCMLGYHTPPQQGRPSPWQGRAPCAVHAGRYGQQAAGVL